MAHRINKTYSPYEMRDVLALLATVGVDDPEKLVKALFDRGYRVIHAGRVIGVRENEMLRNR